MRRVNLKLPDELHKLLVEACEKKGMCLQKALVMLIIKFIEGNK